MYMKKKPLHFLLEKENKTFGKALESFGGSLEVGEVKQFVDASYMPKKEGIPQIGNYVLDKQLSTRKAKVYHDPIADKTVVANRGTTGTVSDWANNAKYLMGNYKKTDRMKQAEKVQKEAIQKYGKVDTNVGHSQGGIITRELNKKGLTNEVINLNPASKGEKVMKNEFVIKSALDPVSVLQKQPKNRTTKTKGTMNLLKEHSSDILNRLNPKQIIGGAILGANIDTITSFQLLGLPTEEDLREFDAFLYWGGFPRLINLGNDLRDEDNDIRGLRIIFGLLRLYLKSYRAFPAVPEGVDEDETTATDDDLYARMLRFAGSKITRQEAINAVTLLHLANDNIPLPIDYPEGELERQIIEIEQQPTEDEEEERLQPSVQEELIRDMTSQDLVGLGKVLKGGQINNMLTNYDIDAYMKKLKIKDYHGCYIKDELPELNKGFYVINLNGQSHWTVLCKDIDEFGNNSYLYFDSFGMLPPTEVEQAIKRDNMGRKTDYFSMENQLQDIDHTSCGFYVIGWCKFLNLKKDKIKAYQDFIKKFTADPSKNDAILKKLIKF